MGQASIPGVRRKEASYWACGGLSVADAMLALETVRCLPRSARGWIWGVASSATPRRGVARAAASGARRAHDAASAAGSAAAAGPHALSSRGTKRYLGPKPRCGGGRAAAARRASR
eukprot:scaffold538_cov412-Prasinococcus_capsulatus_cf.AAC.3